MAKRASQGLQIALILFVMITALLSITTFLYWSKSQELIGQIDDPKTGLKKKLRDAKDREGQVDLQLQSARMNVGQF